MTKMLFEGLQNSSSSVDIFTSSDNAFLLKIKPLFFLCTSSDDDALNLYKHSDLKLRGVFDDN